jgi:ectoine hydroxylase-related dioxygenase (phytanoyl-CoA dioxygenase family)
MSNYISDKFNKSVYDKTGLFIMKDVIPKIIYEDWQKEWVSFYNKNLISGRNVNISNPVHLKEQLPEKLATMYRDNTLINIAKQIHGENLALYNHRFIIKDKFSSEKVFLHQDSCYHLGNLNKCSFFIPLSKVYRDNGGLTFYLGSHKCGYLADAGEINPDAFPFRFEKITPELEPGDFIIMNSHVWHESGPNIDGVDRIMTDIHYQPSDDPTGKELLSGEWKTDIFYSMEDPTQYFINSRILKLKNK